jgi:hypothetical protein
MLVLTDPDGETQDRVVFGPQTTDVSFGRFPNGTGPFVFMDPTFGYENVGGVGVADRCEVAAVRLLEGAFPNPFAGSTAVRFTLPAAGHLTLRVFDAAGRLAAVLADGRQTDGRHEVRFEGGAGRTTGGIYFVQLRVETDAGEHATETLKLVAAR